MKRHRRNTTTVTHYVEIEVEAEVEIEPGEKEIRWGDNACPGCAPSAEILSAIAPAAGFKGLDVMKLLSERDIRAIEDKAIEQADDYDGPDTTAEARGER